MVLKNKKMDRGECGWGELYLIFLTLQGDLFYFLFLIDLFVCIYIFPAPN